jgi:putative copper export protein
VSVFSAPVFNAPVFNAPVFNAPVFNAPVFNAPVFSAPVFSAPVQAAVHAGQLSAVPAPPTPLGPFEDGVVAWAAWLALMGFVGLVALALFSAGPAARRIGPEDLARVTARLCRAAVPLGALAVPAVLTDLAHRASASGGYDYRAAWDSLYDGSNAGRLSGLEVTLCVVGVTLIAPLALRSGALGARSGAPGTRCDALGRGRTWLLVGGLAAGALALGTTKFPTKTPEDWGRTGFATAMWVLHLFGGAVWIGGLAGLLLLALPGGVAAADRGRFWAPAIRRFSAVAMSCVAAIGLSGLFLYWQHVDGPSQLWTTLYGRVLAVKILIFGTLLLLGVFNQFWLHPRVEACRAAGDQRPLHTLLARRFPVTIAAETLLGAAVLLVAPFLHGSARNQAFQANVAAHATGPVAEFPKLARKAASASTWAWGTLETLLVIAVMIGGYYLSGRLARHRAGTDLGDVGA